MLFISVVELGYVGEECGNVIASETTKVSNYQLLLLQWKEWTSWFWILEFLFGKCLVLLLFLFLILNVDYIIRC